MSVDTGNSVEALAAAVSACAPRQGLNALSWPGLVAYRLTSPVGPQWSVARSLSLFVVAQGRKRITTSTGSYEYDPATYLVLTRGQRFRAEIIEASPQQPFLSFVLQLGANTVREMAAARGEVPGCGAAVPPVLTSPLDGLVREAATRFLRTVVADPAVLGPLYLRELAYRLLESSQGERLLLAARAEQAGSLVSDVIAYVEQRLDDPPSVADLAAELCMSPSAFARRFRELTGEAPYQFVKNLRLECARRSLSTPGARTEDVARAVGYGSVSHFITEFRRAFGTTPHTFAVRTRGLSESALDIERATARVAI